MCRRPPPGCSPAGGRFWRMHRERAAISGVRVRSGRTRRGHHPPGRAPFASRPLQSSAYSSVGRPAASPLECSAVRPRRGSLPIAAGSSESGRRHDAPCPRAGSPPRPPMPRGRMFQTAGRRCLGKRHAEGDHHAAQGRHDSRPGARALGAARSTCRTPGDAPGLTEYVQSYIVASPAGHVCDGVGELQFETTRRCSGHSTRRRCGRRRGCERRRLSRPRAGCLGASWIRDGPRPPPAFRARTRPALPRP